MAITICCGLCDYCTDIETTSDTNPARCPECGGELFLTAMGERSDVPLYVDGELNPTLYTDDEPRLGDLGTGHIWFTSVGQPAGCDLRAEEGELYLPDGWGDLRGTIEDGAWYWNGEGNPVDFKANTVQRIVAFLS